MGGVLASSAERRFKVYRHQATLDLFTRHGSFWSAIARIRREFAIAPGLGLPHLMRYARAYMPASIDPGQTGAWDPTTAKAHARWQLLLERLHDDFVPVDCRYDGLTFTSRDFWEEFLSGCVLYDPLPQHLLGYADAVTVNYPDFYEPFGEAFDMWLDEEAPHWEPSEGGVDDRGGFAMLAPPIRPFPNVKAIIADERARHERIIDALHRRLAPRGIDIHEIVADIEFWYVEELVEPEEWLARQQSPIRWCIVVDPETTEADARHAFRMLTAGQPRRPRPVKPSRDPLTCVQCTVWYDQHHWSQEQIGKHMGWAVQYPPAVKPRSETARAYINEGRKILRQRNAARHLWNHEWAADQSGAAD